jgi:D-glycero-alpha-D-manno-heptose 1-phosphate guanylyltransferase
MNAIVLCGGLGTRLGDLTKYTPKPILEVAEKPFITYILDQLLNSPVTEIILAVGFRSDKVKQLIGDSWRGMPIKYSYEDKPLGTGGAIKAAMQLYALSEALVLNGDTFLDIDLNKLVEFSKSKNAQLVLSLKAMPNSSRYGSVIFDENYFIKDFTEKSLVNQSGYINAGVSYVNYSCFELIQENAFSFEKEILVKSANRLNALGFITNGYFIDMGIPEDFAKAQIDFSNPSFYRK